MDTLLFSTIPANSVILLPEDQRSGYLSKIITAPEKIRDLAFSDDTGAYIRGLAKGSKITPDDTPKIALSILEVFIGNKDIADLSTLIAQKTGIDADAALTIASEIDQDLFAPIQGELDAFWASQKQSTTTNPSPPPSPRTGEGNARPTPSPQRTTNVVNLKELAGRPEQKDLPARPIQRKLMPGTRTIDLKDRPSVTPPYEGGARGGSSGTATTNPLQLPLRKGERAATPTPPPVPPKPQFPLPPTRRP